MHTLCMHAEFLSVDSVVLLVKYGAPGANSLRGVKRTIWLARKRRSITTRALLSGAKQEAFRKHNFVKYAHWELCFYLAQEKCGASVAG